MQKEDAVCVFIQLSAFLLKPMTWMLGEFPFFKCIFMHYMYTARKWSLH